MLSIGKLSQLAWMQDHDVPTEKSALDGDPVPLFSEDFSDGRLQPLMTAWILSLSGRISYNSSRL